MPRAGNPDDLLGKQARSRFTSTGTSVSFAGLILRATGRTLAEIINRLSEKYPYGAQRVLKSDLSRNCCSNLRQVTQS
jgi:hypothetical protein